MAKSTLSGWDAVPQKIRQAASRAVLEGAKLVEDEAKLLITNSPATGRVYKRNSVEHTASSPGNPPRSDTGDLRKSIFHGPTDDPMTSVVSVNSDIKYAAALEFGTEKIEPRPFLRPALQNKRKEIEQIIFDQISKALK